jgi:DNA-binding MarR family transcriptional regulator
MNSTDSRNWDEIVDLMRGDIHRLGRDPEHAARFLRRVQGSLDGLTAQFRRSWGINAHEMQSIMTLWEFGRMTMTELGRRIPLSRAAVTTLTDRLEKIDLVRRVPDPTDRRRILLEITERVESEMTRICSNWDARVQAYVEQLDPAVWAQTVDILVNLRQMARDEADVLRAVRSDAPDAEGDAGADGSGPREPVRPTWW